MSKWTLRLVGAGFGLVASASAALGDVTCHNSDGVEVFKKQVGGNEYNFINLSAGTYARAAAEAKGREYLSHEVLAIAPNNGVLPRATMEDPDNMDLLTCEGKGKRVHTNFLIGVQFQP